MSQRAVVMSAHIPSMTDTHSRKRQPRGTTTGGQFATEARSESSISLGATKSDPLDAHRDTVAQTVETLREALSDPSNSVGDEPYWVWASNQFPTIDYRVLQGSYISPLVDAIRHSDSGDDTALDDISEKFARRLEREERWTSHPTFTPPTQEVSQSGTYTTSIGSKSDKMQSVYATSAFATEIRKDLKEAIAAGYLPEDLDIRVRSSGNSVRCQIRGVPENTIFTRPRPEENPHTFRRQYTAETRELLDRVETIGKAYNKVTRDPYTDYYSGRYYCFVDFESDWARKDRQEQEALKKAARGK